MLDPALQAALAEHLKLLQTEVVLRPCLDDSAISSQVRDLLEDLSAASPLVRLGPPAELDHTPSFAITTSDAAPVALRFSGLPLGHEFTSLVLALLHVGGHPPKVSNELLERISTFTVPLHFETYFSQSCQNCPDVVQALNILAARNPHITHNAIDGSSFAAEVAARGVLTVPTVFCNGEVFSQGRTDLEGLVRELSNRFDPDASVALAARLDALDPFDILVVGAGPAGVAAAVYAARKGLRTGVVAERIGGQVLDTMGIENFPATRRTEGPALARDLEHHLRAYPVEVITSQRAVKLHPGSGSNPHQVELASGARLRAHAVVIASGARWRTMGVPGEDAYRNRGVTFCPHCDGPLFAKKRVAVIGGGNSGVEAAIDLAGVASQVTIIEFANELRADAVLLDAMRSRDNVDELVHTETTEVIGDETGVKGLRLRDRSSGVERVLDVDGVFVQIGLVPATDWLSDAIARSEQGEIEVDARGATSLPGIYAAGDATVGPYKQIVVAMGSGASAALGAFEYLTRRGG